MPDGRSGVIIAGGTGGFPKGAVADAVSHVLDREHAKAHLSVNFLGVAPMRALNTTALGHDVVTDVITFTLPQPDGSIVGDIYLCRSEAARSARTHGCLVREELLRLVIHGVLHALGHDHDEGPARLMSGMWRRQEDYLREVMCAPS